MTLDYTKMFLIVTEEAVVKGHFTRRVAADNACSAGQLSLRQWVPLGNVTWFLIALKGALFCGGWPRGQCVTDCIGQTAAQTRSTGRFLCSAYEIR